MRNGASDTIVESMVERLARERRKVRGMMMEEIESLMRLGAEVTGMTYTDKSTGGCRQCVTPKHMRLSYVENGGGMNIQRLHWIFYQLPYGTHTDVLVRRMSHMDWVLRKVMIEMNVEWEPKKNNENSNHKNCMEHMYARVLHEKRTNLLAKVADKDGLHRKPSVKCPRTWEAALYAPNWKRGKRLFFWKSKVEGEHVVCGSDS